MNLGKRKTPESTSSNHNGYYNYIHSHTFFPRNMKWKNAYDKITGNKNFATFSSLTQEIDTHDSMFLSCHVCVSE